MKYCVPLTIVFFSTITVYGQSGHITFGVRGGLNISDIVVNNYLNPDYESGLNLKLGPHIGFFGYSAVTEKVRIGGELLYSSKGVRANSRIDLHYVSAPLLGQYFVTDKFFIEAGPELSYLVSARSPYGDVSAVWDNKLDLGLAAGLHVKIHDKVNVGMRFCAGFLSVIDVTYRDVNNTDPEKIRYLNRVLQITTSYTLGERFF